MKDTSGEGGGGPRRGPSMHWLHINGPTPEQSGSINVQAIAALAPIEGPAGMATGTRIHFIGGHSVDLPMTGLQVLRDAIAELTGEQP